MRSCVCGITTVESLLQTASVWSRGLDESHCVYLQRIILWKKKPLTHLKSQLRLDDHLVCGQLSRTMNPFCLTMFYFYSWLHGLGAKREEWNGCFVCCHYIVCLPYVFCILYRMLSLSLCLPFCLCRHWISLSLGHQLTATQLVQRISSLVLEMNVFVNDLWQRNENNGK